MTIEEKSRAIMLDKEAIALAPILNFETEPLTIPYNSSRDKSNYYYIKRLFDLVVVISSNVFLLPLIAFICLLIKLDSPGPVIFAQERIGAEYVKRKDKSYWRIKPFTIYKFRTMRVDASSKLHQDYIAAYIAGDEEKMAAFQPDGNTEQSYKLRNDPRITRVGYYLRKLSLDELPQIWNVILGNMSLVGPRPPIPYEVEMYQTHQMQRLAAKPGITGFWQVSGRGETSFEQMVQLDKEYIKRQSFWFDLKILILTLPAAFMQKGAG